MKVKYLNSATVIVEHQGKKVLCDPWLTDGIYYGAWFTWPVCKFTVEDIKDVDYIYISHVHPDHFDENTIKDLPKNIPVIILDFAEKFLLSRLRNLGFEKIIEIPNRGEVQLGPDFKVEIMAGDDCNPERFGKSYGFDAPKDYPKTMQIDSLAIFSGGGKVVFNSNDVPAALILHSASYIKAKYPTIDLLLVSYAGAGPYPQAYKMPIDQMMDRAIGAAYSFLSGTYCYIQYLNPVYFMPYAGQYILGGSNHWMNSYKGTIELDEVILDLLPQVRSRGLKPEMVIIDPGETFDVETSQASKPFTPTDFIERDKYIKTELAKKLYSYQTQEYDPYDMTEEFKEARESLWRKQERYGYFSDSQILINAGNDFFYKMNFRNKDVEKVESYELDRPTIEANVDYRLMKDILNRKANWNNAEVGSHIILSDYINKEMTNKGRTYDAMPHFLMSYFQTPVKREIAV